MKKLLALAILCALTASAASAAEIGFIEQFSLAEDRAVPLKELIPGTDDYYYYQCLHLQNQGKLGEVDKVLAAWKNRHKGHYTARAREIRNRQALLYYEAKPQTAIKLLVQYMNLRFDHQKEELGRQPNLPTRLDQKLIDRATLVKRAMSRSSGLNGFEDSAFDFLVTMQLSPDRRRYLLQRLRRPDYPGLVTLVVDDLKYRYSRGFGSMTVHRALLLSQLDDLLLKMPSLLNNSNLVNVYLTKLRPGPDVDWQHDPQAREAYLDRMWAFVKRLGSAHNSLKVHVLYRRLMHDRAKGVYDKGRFMTYIKLPRRVGYLPRAFTRTDEYRRYAANLRADYRRYTQLPIVSSDEPLVRDYLMHFFLKEDTYQPYMTYIRDTYLKEVFAETKIVNGIGDMQKWYSMLSPAKYQALKERVDLDFAATNKTTFRAGEPVSLDLYVKNVKTLIVKVYEINTFNYYRERLRPVGTDVNLDGLVANEEKVHKFEEVALRRVRRSFDFPALRKRGVYVVELIGNGKSSRALVRKGRLGYVERTSTAGHVFTILDESNRKVPDATVWLAGHKYEPDKDGTVVIPFTNRPGRQAIIIRQGEFCSLDHFEHRAEQYSLAAGIHVERESLLKRSKAHVIVRPALYLNGMPVTLSVLEDAALTIQSVDRDGVSTVKQVKDFKLFEDRESTYEFQVPENLSRVSFTLKAKVKSLSRNQKVDLSASAQFSLNGIDRTDKVEDLHLSHAGGAYVLELLGKTGEVKPDRPVHLELKHRDFRRTEHVVLRTDAKGRTALGALKDILWVRAKGPEGTSHLWHLVRDRHSYPATIHGRAGEVLRVPYMGTRNEPADDAFSLLEKRGGTYVKDRRDALSVEAGFIQVKGLAPGDYDLLLKETNTRITLRVTAGQERDGYVLSENRLLETRNKRPLQIAAVELNRDDVEIRLANSSKFARVHIMATRFMPEYPAYDYLGAVHFAEPESISVAKPESVYLSGRNIGDEYRYIIERKYAKIFPGNMLKRPALLLNPWALRKTDTGYEDAKRGTAWGAREAKGRRRAARKHGMPSKRPPVRPGMSSNLDFLGQAAAVLTDLRPDANGVVTVKRKDLGAHQQIHVIAMDPENTVYREVSLPDLTTPFKDLRLLTGLDPKKHYTEQKQITVVQANKSFVLADISTSKFEAYDSLAKVYALYATLSGNSTLREFGFILNWPKLKPEEKQAKYSEYACHELNFFIYKKDPDFFRKVVLPYLKNKKDKTFLDHWLLRDDLSAYLKPWAFAQLNIVERALLAQRVKREQQPMARHVRDLWELIPPNIERFNFLFKTALKGSALETRDTFGLGAAKDQLRAREHAAAAKGLRGLARATTGSAAPKPAAPAPREAPGPEDKAEKLKKLGEAEEKYYDRDAKKRAQVRQYYRKLDKTTEWAENNYYHLPIERQNASLVTVNSFWRDYAAYDGQGGFRSPHLAEATRSFAEMVLALAVLDLPFEAKEHKTAVDGPKFTLNARSPMVVYHKEVKAAEKLKEKTPILVSQNFFKHKDRYRHVNNERVDKYVTDEFIVHTVYGCQVVVTNPTSSRQKLDVLLQVPRGALPVINGFYTRSVHIDLQPYSTRTFDYYFYFPAAGEQPHYPVHVAKNEKLIAHAAPVKLKVVAKPSKIDKTSWDYISQHGSDDDVITYLTQHNIQRPKLSRIAFRMRNKAYFEKVIGLLQKRHVYDHTLWSYALYPPHNVTHAIREYLEHSPFANQCGSYIDCKLLTIDPVVRKAYQHLEYSPLVNARAHKLGKTRKILNTRFHAQYTRLMKVLSYRRKLDDSDLMAVTYYMLLQDRVEQALRFFERVNPARLATQLQYDYFKAYIDFFSDDHRVARGIAEKYKTYPVDRWRKIFVDALSQLDEIEGKAAKVVDDKDRTQVQTKLAATEASFDFKVESRQVTLSYQKLKACTVNYYLMDIELLFSRNPFVQHYAGQFAYIRPNETQRLRLAADQKTFTFPLPQRFHNSNVMVEIVGGGAKKSQAYYSHSLALQVIENYGQVKVSDRKTGKPLPKVYVKVYARMKGGRVRFYKDGYTDLRGRFDYTSLNTNELDNVDRFSLLVMSNTAGAVIREAAPPKR